MSEENVNGADSVPVSPVKKGGIDLKTADLSTLRTAFESALAERSAIDARIDELRKAIAARLKEFQSLNDTVSNLNYTRRGTMFTIPSINWGKVRSFLWSWVIPAVILFVFLWFGVKGVKSYYTTPKTDKIPIEQSIIPGHNVQMWGNEQEGELWS